MATAYSYIRFSSEKQQLGDSLRRQVEQAEKYARLNGLTLDHSTYRDLGISAFKGRNASEGKLGTFLAAVERGLIERDSTLLIEDFDRLSRDEIDNALSLFLRVIQSGITLVTLKDGQVYTRERIRKDQASLIVSIMYMGRAHDESMMKSRRVSQAWEEKRKAGKPMTAMAPAWLELSPDRMTWKVLPEKASTVQKIFALALAGNGSPSIARILNEEAIPPMKSATSWSFGTVAAILKNPAVMGTYRSRKVDADPIAGYYPAIVSEADYVLASVAMTKRRWVGGRSRENVANLFSGISFCHVCGEKMRVVGSNGRHIYLKCFSAYSGTGCDEGRFPYLAAERALLRHLADDFSEALTQPGDQSEDSLAVLRGRRDDIKRRIGNLVDSLADVGAPQLRNKINELQLELQQTELEIEQHIPAAHRHEARYAAAGLFESLKGSVGDELSQDLRLRLQTEIRRMIAAVYFWCDDENDRPTVALQYLPELGGHTHFFDVRQYMEKVGGSRSLVTAKRKP